MLLDQWPFILYYILSASHNLRLLANFLLNSWLQVAFQSVKMTCVVCYLLSAFNRLLTFMFIHVCTEIQCMHPRAHRHLYISWNACCIPAYLQYSCAAGNVLRAANLPSCAFCAAARAGCNMHLQNRFSFFSKGWLWRKQQRHTLCCDQSTQDWRSWSSRHACLACNPNHASLDYLWPWTLVHLSFTGDTNTFLWVLACNDGGNDSFQSHTAVMQAVHIIPQALTQPRSSGAKLPTSAKQETWYHSLMLLTR